MLKNAKISIDKKKLNSVFKKYPEIKAVYLFGSRATNKVHLESDLDLAIITDKPDFKKKKLRILSDLIKAGYENVDLVIPDNTNIVLLHEIVKHNHCIYAVPNFDTNSFFAKVVGQYLDFLPYLKVHIDYYKKRNL